MKEGGGKKLQGRRKDLDVEGKKEGKKKNNEGKKEKREKEEGKNGMQIKAQYEKKNGEFARLMSCLVPLP